MKLVTWNVQWCLGCDGIVDPRRIVEHARAFADFDVLCLQEVAANFPSLKGSAGEDQFAALLPRRCRVSPLLPGSPSTPRPQAAVAATFGNSDPGAGFRPLQAMRLQLPWPFDAVKRSMPRLLLEATIEAPFGPLRVMTTHLEYYSAPQRAAQVEALRARHAEACGHALAPAAGDASPGPFQRQPQTVSAILTGDFNLRTSDPLHARLMAPFADSAVPALEDAWQCLHPGIAQPPTAGVHDHEQWPEAFACDFIFTSADLRPRLGRVAVDAATAASDHQPVLIELD